MTDGVIVALNLRRVFSMSKQDRKFLREGGPFGLLQVLVDICGVAWW